MRIENTPDHYIQHISLIIMSLVIRTYARGSDWMFQKSITGWTNPEWRSNECESPEMHQQQFCQPS